MQDLQSFLSAIHFADIPGNQYNNPLLIGNTIQVYPSMNFGLEEADIVIVGCGEKRGHDASSVYSDAPNAVRKAFYNLYDWHKDIKIADLGNVLEGATVGDTRAALRIILKELYSLGKPVIILGGSQDLTLQQYDVFKQNQQTIDASVIDRFIDLDDEELVTDRSYLMDMLTTEPNFVRNYHHIGFQSYDVNPKILETLDKLRFDFYRLGVVREDMEEMEPVLRQSHLFSIDMSAVRKSDAPFLENASPNGFFGDEMCQLTHYAGMSPKMSSLGIYGYNVETDTDAQGAKLIAQMLWYFIDGFRVRKSESPLSKSEDYLIYNVHFTQRESVFIKSKITDRWWMQMPDNSYIPCSYKDYQKAVNNETPERWLREIERLS